MFEAFPVFLHDEHLNPVWCCVEKQTEKYLAEDLSWDAVMAVAEERINPSETDLVEHDKTTWRKICHAEHEYMKIIEVGQELGPGVREQLE